MLLKGRFPERPWELHKNYVLFQEFIADNPFDIRIVIIGNRAFAKRRFNRSNDFRASGNGRTDTDPSMIDHRAISLAFKVSKVLGTQSLAFDILCRNREYVVSEISYTYPSWSQHLCPGHWRRKGEKIVWEQGQMWPEEAQVEDFLVRLKEKQIIRDMVCI
jgi:glutathione synthase/RimK-type ligase-like ATP-grasp enzyme